MYGIYANIGGILMGSMLPYIAYMDPMGNCFSNISRRFSYSSPTQKTHQSHTAAIPGTWVTVAATLPVETSRPAADCASAARCSPRMAPEPIKHGDFP